MSVRSAASLCIWAAFAALAIAVASCSSQKTAPPQPPPQQLLGDLKPLVSVKELMRDMIDPASDFVFNAVSDVSTKTGVVQNRPTTEEDWERIRIGAVTMAEGVYLLKIPRAFAPAGDENDSRGENPPELSPAQIKAKIEKDPVMWNAKIEALRNVGLEVMDIVKRKDVDELWDAAENLDAACENCHVEYWYPGQKVTMPELDRKIQELYGPLTKTPKK
jgi:hypothetical protein